MSEISQVYFKSRVKGIDGSLFKLSELLSGRGGNADAVVNVTVVGLRFGAVVLTKKLVFDKPCEKIGLAGSHLYPSLRH